MQRLPFSGATTLRFEGPLSVGHVEGAASPVGESMPVGEGPRIRAVWPSESHVARTDFESPAPVGTSIRRERSEWNSAAVTYAEFGDALVHLPTGVLISGRHLWCDASVATVLNAQGRVRGIDFFVLGETYFRIVGHGETEPERLNRPAMVLGFWASYTNYGHWLANSLLSVYFVLDRLQIGELALVCPPLSKRQFEDLFALGVPKSAIVETSAQYVRGEILYPSALSTSTNVYPGSWAASFFSFLKQRLGSDGETGAKRVYLSRRKFAGSGRVMSNEDVLIARLAHLGFLCADPHELDMAGQMRLMSQAQIVVGQFGAALWNLGFAPRGCAVVEITVDAYAGAEFLFLSSLLGLRFVRVMASAGISAADAGRGRVFSFEAPVDDILAVVRCLLEQRA